MADLQSGQTFINVLPSMTGYFKKVRAEVQNNKIEQNIGVKVDQRRLDQAKRALEATVKAEETARRKAADAAGAQVVAEAKLQALRDKGVTDVGRLSAAEQTLEKAKRNSIAASQALSDAEGKRKVADRRVQRVEATFDSSKAETQSDSFLQRLAAKAESSGQGIGSRLVAGIGQTAKAGALAVGGTIAGVLGVAAKKGIDRMLAIDDAKGKLLGLGNTAADVEAIMANASASVKGTAFGLGEAAGLAGTLVASGIKPGEALERQLKLVADAATVSGSDLGEMGQIWGKVAAKGKLDGEVMAQMLERQIPIFDILGKKYGKSAEEIQKMVSDGKVSFADFADAMQAKVGGAALASGATVRGAAKNMGAALGRLGEAALAPFFGQATTVFGGVTGLIDKMTARSRHRTRWLPGQRTVRGQPRRVGRGRHPCSSLHRVRSRPMPVRLRRPWPAWRPRSPRTTPCRRTPSSGFPRRSCRTSCRGCRRLGSGVRASAP
ncbi:tape measure protein [Rhodococcus hoagii]|nr:tape measure protein [Prescottella equi]